MEHLPENNAEQGNHSAAIPLTSLGRMLREARERLGLSVADVADQIKFAPRQIEALEADDFKRLPEAAFLRGFVCSYAKILNMDAQTLLAVLPQTKAVAAESIPASVGVPFPVAHSSHRQNLILLGAALLLAVIAVGFAVWHFTTPLKQSEVAKIEPPVPLLETPIPLPAEMPIITAPPVPKQNTIAPAIPAEPKLPSSATVEQPSVRTAKTATAKAVPQTKSTDSASHGDTSHGTSTKTTALRLVFDEESWTEIKDKDGKMLSSQVNPRGSELNLEGRLPLSLVIGHAATTHLYQDGEQVDLTPYINSSSEVVRLTLE
jgi:cytoskeleton protein RodZ